MLVGVNYVYTTKENEPCLPGADRANWRVNYKSDPHGPDGSVSGALFQNPR